MNNITNVLKMIDLLNTGKKYKVSELSKILNVSSRMIRYYKEKINESGLYIDSYKGVDGGYVLYKKLNYYNQLNKYDVKILKDINKKLNDDKLQKVIEKLDFIDVINNEDNIYDILIDDNEKTDLVKVLEKNFNKKITIIYENIEGINRKRTVIPYQIFKHQNFLYVICFCEYKQDFRHFEISRIKLVK